MKPEDVDARLVEKAYQAYLDDYAEGVAIYGVLIHVAEPKRVDLEARAVRLSATLVAPTTMELIAIYLSTDVLARIADANVVVETAA